MDKKRSRRVLLRGKPIALAVSAAFLPWSHALALPQGGEVVEGQATISRPQAGKMQIDQASHKAILDWRSFSIKRDETVNFLQPNASAVALNRVVGSSSSEIYGALNANGQVFLVNTNGILFAPGSSVNVGGLVATTLSISNEDFLSGNYVFQRDASDHSRSVVNRGSIVTPNGYTALFGPQVRNEGVIIANSGSIALGAGDRVSLDLVGDNLIRLNVDQAALKASIVNTGSLVADGGIVILKASSAGGLLDTVINTSGVIRANALVERDGAIVLHGGSSGIVAVSGNLQAAGGAISVGGATVALLGAARLDASGETGGGGVLVDAGVLVVGANASVRADATVSGSGGEIVLAGRDATSVQGAVSAQGAAGAAGGVVETSGGSYLNVTDAPAVGAGGTWIIASDSLVVSNGSQRNTVGASLISGQLDAGANVVLDARGADGDVTINAAIGKANATAASLTLTATDAVTVNAPISLANGGLIVNAGALTNNSAITNSGGVAVANNIVFNADAFNLAGGTINAGSAVILRPRTGTNSFGIESAGDTTVTNGDIASINTSNFVVFGSGLGTTFTGNMVIGQNAQVDGGAKNLAFFRSQQPGGTTTIGSHGLTTGGDVIINAGGGAIVSNGGSVRGDEVQLLARDGIGSAHAPVRTAANVLGIANTSLPPFQGSFPMTGNVFVSEADNVTLRDITVNVGGIINSTGNFSSGMLALSAGGSMDVAGPVSSLGAMTLNVAGDLSVVSGGMQDAGLRSSGGQLITARSLAVTSKDGRLASVSNVGPAAQTIIVSGGAGVDVQTLSTGGLAQISAEGGGVQTISVVDGDHINVNGLRGDARISAIGANQTLSITGSGANAITLGAAGSLGPSQVFGGVQNVAAGAGQESGSITIVGGNRDSTFTGFSSGQVMLGTQTVSTSGTLRIAGGDAPSQPPSGFATGLFHNGSGAQTVNAANIEMQGGSSGVNNTAIIISSGGNGTIAAGNQVINAAGGNIELTGGAGGANNTAIVVSFADQTVSAGNVELMGGTAGVNNGAFINIAGAGPAGSQSVTISGDLDVAGGAGGNAGLTGSATWEQTISANNIHLTNSAGGGNNSVGFIQGRHQAINARGDVTLTARASGGDLAGVRIGGLGGSAATATNLTLNVDGNLVLTGGASPGNGVGIGSTAALDNTINISARGDIKLGGGVAGSGVRIGSAASTGSAGGNISLNGRSIHMDGGGSAVAIRTRDSVTLGAFQFGDTITQTGNAFIEAGRLNANSSGNVSLVGPNLVSSFGGSSFTGDVTLNNTGALPLEIISMGGVNAAVTHTADVKVSGMWSTSSATKLTTVGPESDLTVKGLVQSFGPMTLDISGTLRVVGSGMQNAWLTSFGGQSITAGAIEISSDNGASAIIGNNPSIGGEPSRGQTINVSGGGLIIRSNGPGGLALLTNGSPQNQSIKVSGPSGIDVLSISGGNAQIFNVGPGSQTIEVSGGGIDLHTESGGGFAFIGTGSGGSQVISVIDGDHIGVNARSGFAFLSSGGAQSIAITGIGANAIMIGSHGAAGRSGIGATGDQSVVAGQGTEAGSITIMGSSAPLSFAGISNNVAPQSAPALHTQTVKTSGTLSALGGSASQSPTSFSNVGVIQNHAGKQTINAENIALHGGPGGRNNGAFIGTNAGGDQQITVTRRIDITGGAGGNNNRALINSAGNQTIDGNPIIVVTGGAGGGQEIGNLAGINAFNSAKEQHIYAQTIELRSGAGGVDNAATITGRKQRIETEGDVVMSGGASTGQLNGTRIGGLVNPAEAGPTQLTMIVGGSLLMSGGSAPFNGSGIGSAAGGLPQVNNIDITATDHVILNPGTGAGARIGTSVLAAEPSGGTISIKAGGNIKLNGDSPDTLTAIRTTDSVTLIAGGSISEGTHGRIDAASLKTESGTNTILTGQNRIKSFSGSSTMGDVSLVNTLPVQILGVTAAGNVIVDNAGDVTVGGVDASSPTLVYAPGDVTITAPGFTIIVQGSNTTAGARSEVRAGGTATLNAQEVLLIDGTAPDAPATVISGAAE